MNLYFTGVLILIFSGFITLLFKNEFRTKVLSVLSVVASVFCLIPAVNVLVTNKLINTEFYFKNREI